MNELKNGDVIGSLLSGMDKFLSSKTVVGEPIRVGDTTLIPLVDVSFGIAAGTGQADKKSADRGGMGGRMTPNAVIMVKDGRARLINIRNQDAVTRILDLVPELLGRFTEPRDKENNLSDEEAVDIAFDRSENN
ncbi:MAG: GerW family sporulation protein [Lachnospiraceae bacterium]|nr:GerW family sporulation protein [Lachnospiraceae bacterium]